MTALRQAKPHTLHPACSYRRRVCIALGASERVPRVPVCASARAKGAPAVAVRARIMRGGTVLGVDARPSAWQAVKRSLVWLVASRVRQVKRSLCMACVGLVWRWRDASRRACALACVRWRSLRTSASCARRLHVRMYPCASNFLRIMRV